MPVFISIGSVPKDGVAGSHGPREFFYSCCLVVLQSGCTPARLHSCQWGRTVLVVLHLFFTLDVVRVYYFSPYGLFWPWDILLCKMPIHISCLLLLIGLSVFFH